MPTLETYHVKSHDDGWAVEAEGAQRPSAVEAKKAAAVSRAREIAGNKRPSKVIVHKMDGTVQDEFTYGDVEAATPSRTEPEKNRANDAGYALAALASDALQLATEALQLAKQVPARAQGRVQQVSGRAQTRAQELRDLQARRSDLEAKVREFREEAEELLDEKAAQGRGLTEGILNDERIRRVLDQARTAQSQVKAALTSIRKTGGAAAGAATTAGKQQASTATSQVKAAATSVKKTADAAVGKD